MAFKEKVYLLWNIGKKKQREFSKVTIIQYSLYVNGYMLSINKVGVNVLELTILKINK